MTEKYSKEEREFWREMFLKAWMTPDEYGGLTLGFDEAVQCADDAVKTHRERFGARPDEPVVSENSRKSKSLEKVKEELGRINSERLTTGKYEVSDKPKTVKRSEIKAGEWYQLDGRWYLAMHYRDSSDDSHYHYVDWTFEDLGQPSYDFISPSELVTPCPPPEWFSEIWERKR